MVVMVKMIVMKVMILMMMRMKYLGLEMITMKKKKIIMGIDLWDRMVLQQEMYVIFSKYLKIY
ncbi:hypothetical protein B9K03_11790, partial [Rothia sp. Olga]